MEQRLSSNNLPGESPTAKLSESLLAAANGYLARGWPVIPLHGKLPAVCWKEFQKRLPTGDELRNWFTQHVEPPTGLGVVTGSLSGLVVVDCDSRADAGFWQAEHGGSSHMASTGGGGVHLYYAMPPGEEVRNRAHLFGRRIDVRGEGGYVTAPPSKHPSGVGYEWLLFDGSATLPLFNSSWLAQPMRESSFPRTLETKRIRYALAYIRRIQANTGEGGHNATFRAACRLRDAGLSEDEALGVLSTWNETNASPPWSTVELEHKICSAFARGN